jgi:alpha-mannosidase
MPERLKEGRGKENEVMKLAQFNLQQCRWAQIRKQNHETREERVKMSDWRIGNHKKMISLILAAALAVSSFTSVTAMAAPREDVKSDATLDSGWTMYLVPNAHIDTAWQWPFEETARDVISATFSRAVNALKSNPEYKFTMSASKHYEWAKEYYPEMYEDIKELIENGQWDNPGGQVVEPDLNLPSGEALVRQSLEGQRFFQKEFGKMSTVGYVPDTFGFNGQFPQILKKAGMNSFVTTKLNWQDTNVERDSDIFKWSAIDGTQVLAYAPMRDYVNMYTDSQIKSALKRNAQVDHETGVKEALGMMGEGDHGGGPKQNEYADVLKKNGSASVDGVQVKLATISEYFDDVKEKEQENIEDNVRTVEGEMYFENHRGTYTSWARQKEYNRKNEILAEKAEKASTLGNWLGVLPEADNEKISKAWDKILVNQFHDILPGSSIPYQYQVTYNNQELAKNLLNNVQSSGLQAIAYRADTKNGVTGIPVMVFNPLSWERDDTVELALQFDDSVPEKLAVYDVAGDIPVASCIVSKDQEAKQAIIRFEAKELPAIGYKVFDIRAEDAPVENGLTVKKDSDTFIMENNSLKVMINAKTGNIAQIYNKGDDSRQVFADGYEGNELQILKDTGGSSYPAWDLVKSEMNASPVATLNTTPDSIKIVEDTPVRKVVRVSRAWSKSTFVQDIILSADSERVDVKMNVNWNEDQRMLKIAFPFAADASKASYEIAYGSLDRPTTRDNVVDAAKFEVSGHKWADVTDDSGSFGASILNDSKYGWDALRITNDAGDPATRLRLTALRSPIGSTVRNSGSWGPQAYYIDKTEHNFTYSIYPHAGTWQDADTEHRGYELNYRTEAVQADPHESRGLDISDSFASSSEDNVLISVLKTPADEPDSKDQMIVRVYEAEGQDDTDVTITLPSNVVSAKEVNLLEQEDETLDKAIETDGNKLKFHMGKYEIATIAVELQPYEREEAVALRDSSVDLFDYYNVDAVSFNEKKKDGNYDGKGDTIPAELWPDTVSFQGVNFQLGPTNNGYDNMVQANGQTIALPEGNYRYVYLLGAGAGSGGKNGTFTVKQSDGTAVTKDLSFADWDTNLSGWDRFTNSDIHPYVKDQVGYFFTHFHNGSTDRMTVDNYLFVYAIPVDPEKTLESIQLPKASGIKIAAITAADSDFLRNWNEGVSESGEQASLPAITGVSAELVTGEDALGDQARIEWDLRDGISLYRIYRGVTSDFTLENAEYLGIAGDTQNSYIDTLPYNGEFYYKVIGIDASSNRTVLSEASKAVRGGLDNAFLTVPSSRITAPGGYQNEEPYRACDGDTGTKWCYRADGLYLQVDLGEENDWEISKFTLVNAGNERQSYITRDFSVLSSNDGKTWKMEVRKTDNTSNVVEMVLPEPVSARYFRLVPDYAGQTSSDRNCPRIYEFQAWGTSSQIFEPSVKDVAIKAYKDENDSTKVTFTGDYGYVNSGVAGTEGATKLQWFRSRDGGSYEEILNATGKTLTMDAGEALKVSSFQFKVTPVDKYGTEGEPAQAIYILNEPGKDILTGKETVASHQFKDEEGGAMLTDGNFATKWCADGVYPNDPRYAVIDLNGVYDLSRIQIWHSTAPSEQNIPGDFSSDNKPEWNTRDYKIYVSDDKENWHEITSMTGNSNGITEHLYSDGKAVGRYLKLEVSKGVDFGSNNTPADGNSCVRIYEVLGYGKLIDFINEPKETVVDDVTAKNVSVENDSEDRLPAAGDQLKAGFDLDSEYAGLARMRWLVSDAKTGPFTPIPNSYSETLTVGDDFVGRWVRVEIKVDQGAVVASEPVQILDGTVRRWNIHLDPYREEYLIVSVDKTAAAAGESVKVTASPITQDKRAKVTIDDAQGNSVPVDAKEENVYSFVMPDRAVTVTVTAEEVAPQPAATGIRLNPSSVSISVGGSQTIQATVYDQFGSAMSGIQVTWSSSNTDIVTVDQTGKITAVRTGTAVVSTSYGELKATANITVKPSSGGKPSSSKNSRTSDTPKEPIVQLDTGSQLSVEVGKTYQFKITASSKPTFVCGSDAVFLVDYAGSVGNDYFFKVTAIGAVGQSAGFYVNGEKTPRTVGTIVPALDTGRSLDVQKGGTYQFKVTAPFKPAFVCGNGSVFRVLYAGSVGNEHFFKVTAIGSVGQSAGFYVNGEKVPRTISTIR